MGGDGDEGGGEAWNSPHKSYPGGYPGGCGKQGCHRQKEGEGDVCVGFGATHCQHVEDAQEDRGGQPGQVDLDQYLVDEVDGGGEQRTRLLVRHGRLLEGGAGWAEAATFLGTASPRSEVCEAFVVAAAAARLDRWWWFPQEVLVLFRDIAQDDPRNGWLACAISGWLTAQD